MSLSDISDLTDLSSDEEDVPLSKRNTKAKKPGPKEYKIRNVLRAPRTAQYTAKSLYDQIIENAIDLDPEYQRDVVWQEEKQSGLIDSLLRNYYIPPIIFAVNVQDDGSELRTCIDGKQRLTSIQRFFDGQIPHKDSFTNEKLWFKQTAGNTKRKLLPQYLRSQFTNKQIVCIEYTELNDDQEREIFQRVQLGVALTPAERLQALAGPWSTTIREIQNHVLGEEGFEGYLDWGHARGRDFQCLATIGYLIENHPKTTVPGTKALEKWLQRTQSVSTQLRADLHETFRILVALARDKKYSGSLNRPTRVSPIEFVTIGVLIYLKRKTLSLTQISSAIEKMRKDVRASHTDIRSNTRVTKHLMEFMAKKIKVSELKSDGEGDKPAASVVAKAAKSVKRKRPSYSDDSDSDDLDRISKAKPSGHPAEPTKPTPVEVTKPSKRDQKPNGKKKTGAASIPQTSVTAKSSQPPGSSRKTNNSMSGMIPATAEKPPLLTPAINTNTQALPPPSLPPTSNGHNSHVIPKSEPTLTVQTGPTIKAESPLITSLNSPAPISVVDRLAPIRAAKASLVSGIGVQPPSLSKGSETRGMLGPIAQTIMGPSQNPIVPQLSSTLLLQQQPLPHTPSVQSLSQHFAANPGQVDGVLQTLRSQFPHLDHPTQTKGSNTVNIPPGGAHLQSNGTTGHPMIPIRIPGMGMNANTPGDVSQGHGTVSIHGTSSANTGLPPPWVNPNQVPGSYGRPPLSLGMSGNTTSDYHQPPSASAPTGTHTLPQRPLPVPSAPNGSTRAEPLGLSRSTSSESASWQGSYSRDRHRDERRPSRFDRDYEDDRKKRNRYYR